ncbi:MAG: amidohydrolase, partial [Chloroflexota bacterium]
MPLDTLVTGRIATLAGDVGFGWVEALGIRDGRVAFAGSEVELETRADPHTQRIALEPDEVGLPGLTDAHLHLAEAALARDRIDLTTASSLAIGLERIGRVAAERPDADTLEGHGWDVDRWGGWPTADALERVAPGRRIVVWAHDHHPLWASRASHAEAGIGRDTVDPDGGLIRRGPDGEPEGVVLEAATGLVTARVGPPDLERLATSILAAAREALELGIVACHDPGPFTADPGLNAAWAAYEQLARRAMPIRVHVSVRQDSLPTAVEQGLRSGAPIVGGADDARIRVGWLKLFADGSLGSRTAALLDDIEGDPDDALAGERRRGVWVTSPEELGELARTAAEGGIATQIHAIGDAAVRAALDVLEASGSHGGLLPRIEHVQLLDPADRGRFAAAGIVASVQPVHLRSDAPTARRLWGGRAESIGYPLASLGTSGAVLAFGTDAPIEPF